MAFEILSKRTRPDIALQGNLKEVRGQQFTPPVGAKSPVVGFNSIFRFLGMVRPERFELPTLWFEAKCSIQLSYGRLKEA